MANETKKIGKHLHTTCTRRRAGGRSTDQTTVTSRIPAQQRMATLNDSSCNYREIQALSFSSKPYKLASPVNYKLTDYPISKAAKILSSQQL